MSLNSFLVALIYMWVFSYRSRLVAWASCIDTRSSFSHEAAPVLWIFLNGSTIADLLKKTKNVMSVAYVREDGRILLEGRSI